MAIVSAGYAGTVTDAQWAKMVPHVGVAMMSVDDFGSFRVTAAAGTRTVRVAAGSASAAGIYDTSDAAVNVVLGDVASGVRWDLIVLRRNWASKASSVVAIPGSSTKTLPSRNKTPGTTFDQPLALVRVTAGSTVIQEVVDLRVAVTNGGAVGWDDLTRSYLTELGTVIRIGDVVWYRVTNSSGAATWVSDDMTDTGWVAAARGPNWRVVAGYPLQVRRIGNLVEIRGAVMSQQGANKDNLGTVPAGFRPASSVPLGATHTNSSAWGQLFVDSVGRVWMDSRYRSGDNPADEVVMIHGHWFIG